MTKDFIDVPLNPFHCLERTMYPTSKRIEYVLYFENNAQFTIEHFKLEDLMVLNPSPDLLNNVKIGQDQLRLIMKHILFYWGYGHFG